MRRLEAKLDHIVLAVSSLGNGDLGPVYSQHKSTTSETRAGLSRAGRGGSSTVVGILDAKNDAEDSGRTTKATNREQLVGHEVSRIKLSEGQQAGRLESPEASRRLDLLQVEWSEPSKPDSSESAAPADTECRAMKVQLEGLDRTLALVAGAVGVHNHLDSEESSRNDRRRLKEKLKAAMEVGQRLTVRQIKSERAMWLDYVFGICKPDGRVGKGGSK